MMQILAYAREFIKKLLKSKANKCIKINGEYVIYGPNKTPKWHPLYREKCYSWGTYKRMLILEDDTRVTVIIQRFYHVASKKTYSLLPFFLSPYQRHMNKVIEECITKYIREGESVESIARDPAPEERTVRSRIRRFIESLDLLVEKFELFLSIRLRNYRVASKPLNTVKEKFDYLYARALKINDSKYTEEFGTFSYIYYLIALSEAER